MCYVLLIVITILCNVHPVLASDLGSLVPGENNAQTITIGISKHLKPENHYAQILDTNFVNGNNVFLTTNDGRLITSEPTEVFVNKKDTSYNLTLQIEPSIAANTYWFILYTYTTKNGKLIAESQKTELYSFEIGKWITIEEITPWYHFSFNETWAANSLSLHTIKIMANDDWSLYAKCTQDYQGLHAVFIEKDPEFVSFPTDFLVTQDLLEVLKGSKTTGTKTEEKVITIVLYFDDWTAIPAGKIDISLYLEARITTKASPLSL